MITHELAAILRQIAGRLVGMAWDDLTTAEQQIVTILIDAGYLVKSDDGEVTHPPQ